MYYRFLSFLGATYKYATESYFDFSFGRLKWANKFLNPKIFIKNLKHAYIELWKTINEIITF